MYWLNGKRVEDMIFEWLPCVCKGELQVDLEWEVLRDPGTQRFSMRENLIIMQECRCKIDFLFDQWGR